MDLENKNDLISEETEQTETVKQAVEEIAEAAATFEEAAEEAIEAPEAAPKKKKCVVGWLILAIVLLLAAAVAVLYLGSDRTAEEYSETMVFGGNDYSADAITDAVVATNGKKALLYVPDVETNGLNGVARKVAPFLFASTSKSVDQLTNAKLALYYWDSFYTFYNQYGFYASYMGLDPLHMADTEYMEGQTWQEYFLSRALTSYRLQTAVYQKALAEGFTLPEERQKDLDNIREELSTTENIQDELVAVYGEGITTDMYLDYVTTGIYYVAYMDSIRDSVDPTDAELTSYFEEHSDEMEAQGITMTEDDTTDVNVRHILITPEDAEDEASWAAAEQKANEIYANWQAGEKTEDSFAALATENTDDPGSKENGGLYEDVYPGQMVEEFNDWCFDADRQTGDSGIVKTSYGYHIMYFVGRTENVHWKSQVKSSFATAEALRRAEEIALDYDFSYDTSLITIALPGQIKDTETAETTEAPAETAEAPAEITEAPAETQPAA